MPQTAPGQGRGSLLQGSVPTRRQSCPRKTSSRWCAGRNVEPLVCTSAIERSVPPLRCKDAASHHRGTYIALLVPSSCSIHHTLHQHPLMYHDPQEDFKTETFESAPPTEGSHDQAEPREKSQSVKGSQAASRGASQVHCPPNCNLLISDLTFIAFIPQALRAVLLGAFNTVDMDHSGYIDTDEFASMAQAAMVMDGRVPLYAGDRDRPQQLFQQKLTTVRTSTESNLPHPMSRAGPHPVHTPPTLLSLPRPVGCPGL